MQSYSVNGWVPLNFNHEFVILNSDMDIDDYTKLITSDKEIKIKFKDVYSQTHTSENGFTKLKLIHLVYDMLKNVDSEIYNNENSFADMVFDGFTYDPLTSTMDIQTSS